MKDNFSRQINYLRLSVTDKCNLRCKYCFIESDKNSLQKNNILSYSDFLTAVCASRNLGITKVRLTGGEPLCYPKITELVKDIRNIQGIESVHITTNGILLSDIAKELKKSGLKSINISLDTLDREKYKNLTGFDKFDEVIKGLENALSVGFNKVKINVVLISGFNDDEIVDFVHLTKDRNIDVRFIELMPMTSDKVFGVESCISSKIVLQKCSELKKVPSNNQSVAVLYSLDNAKGRVGLIEPIFSSFCDRCNRIRITSDGYVKPCLHSHDEFSLFGLDEKGMENVIRKAIEYKPKEHDNFTCMTNWSDAITTGGRSMKRIGG